MRLPTRCAAGSYRKKIYTAGNLAACSANNEYHTNTKADCVSSTAGQTFAYPYNSTCVGESEALLWRFS